MELLALAASLPTQRSAPERLQPPMSCPQAFSQQTGMVTSAALTGKWLTRAILDMSLNLPSQARLQQHIERNKGSDERFQRSLGCCWGTFLRFAALHHHGSCWR